MREPVGHGVEAIRVSRQTIFSPLCPNFPSGWTLMLLST